MALLLKLTQKLAHGFQGFWDRWPRKVAKFEAEKEWNKIKPDPALEETIHKALDWQIPIFEQREPQYIPHARKWLHHRRWEDEPPTKTVSRPTVPLVPKAETPMALQQMDAARRIRSLMATGMDRETAERQVYREMGWTEE